MNRYSTVDCEKCGGGPLVQETRGGHYQCKKCGRAVAPEHVHDDRRRE